MKKISTIRLKPGMVAEKPIVTKRGQVIAPAGTKLTSQLIARLSFYKIDTVMVQDSSIPEDAPEDLSVSSPEVTETVTEPATNSDAAPKEESLVEKTQSYSQRVKSTPQYQEFQRNYTKNIVSMKETFAAITSGRSGEVCANLLAESAKLFSSKTSLELFDMIHTMRSMDDSTYAHSLNVALISRAIGKWLQLSREDLDILTLAGLLHDIGKTQIPDEILNKQGKLTDEEFDLIKSHAKKGHSILKNTNLDKRIKLAALQHHERFDGTGYPRGLEADEIDTFASIVAIADVYDAMTAARSYRAPQCAFQVIACFEQEGFQKYNPNVIYTFLQRVAGCYNNSRVLLSNGVTGRVVFLNKNSLSRPIIETDGGQVIDLSSSANKELFIKSIV
ncbi:MAG: HD-GYP domain-containing protein [Lachnospiraceae bacterium]|nr:HD-GYP domain-containing protein [Lachnospiraceae bacterium]